jgi:hypothetical protein
MFVTGGTLNVSAYFQLRLTAGGDATGLTITDFDLTYTRSGDTPAAKADATDLGSANAAHTDNGGYEVDSTDAPGLHRFDFPDAAFAAGVQEVMLTVKHASAFTETIVVSIDAPMNATKISGDETAADNLEAQFDGTGYLHDTAPATQIQLAGLSGGLAVPNVAESSTVTQGSETNTFAETATHDGTFYIVTDSGAGVGIDFFLQFDLGGEEARAVDFHLHGFFEDQGAADKTLAVQAWNWNTSTWQTIETLTNASSSEAHDIPLNTAHTGESGGDHGLVRIRFVQSAQEGSNAMNIDHCTVGSVTALMVDPSGFVLLSDGTGAGQIALASGTVDVGLIEGVDATDAINAEVSDVLKTDTINEMAQGLPPVNPTFEEAVMYLYHAFRNDSESTTTERKIKNDAGTVIAKATMTEAANVFNQGKLATGP